MKFLFFLAVAVSLTGYAGISQEMYQSSPLQIELIKLKCISECSTYSPNYTDDKIIRHGAAFEEGDFFRVRISNSSEEKLYYTFIDARFDNIIDLIIPWPNQEQEDYYTQGGDSVNLPEVYYPRPPFGTDKMILIASPNPKPGNYLKELIKAGGKLPVDQADSAYAIAQLLRQEISWILQGQPSRKFKDCHFSVFELALIPKTSGTSSAAVRQKVSGLMNVKNFTYHFPADTADQQCLKNPEAQKKLFLEYPMMSLIQPFQAGATTRGVIGEHVSTTKKYVLKGFVSASRNIIAIKINGRASAINAFDEHQFAWEKEVDLKEGKNQFQVIAITDDGKQNCQDVILVYNKADDLVAAPGKNYSLVIGINEYKNINPLSAARRDATDFKALLQQYYQFEEANSIALLDKDATRDNIDSVFSLLISKLTPNDNLVVYFAGHGLLDKQLNEGYWIPVEARSNKRVDYIPNAEIKKYLEALKAKHVVVFADACFSGSFFKTNRGETFADKVEKQRSKWLFCSGREEEVADMMSGQKNSPFAYYLMKFLREYKGDGMAVSELAQMVKVAVANNAKQTPIWGPIRETGDEGGEFVFRKK